MARGGSRGRRSSYVRDNSGRFASTPGGGPPKRSTPASRRAARPKVTGGTLGARGSLRRSRTKLASKDPADRSLQGTLSLRAQKGAVTRGANRLGKVRAASTVRMAGKGPAGVIRGGRKVAAKPVAAPRSSVRVIRPNRPAMRPGPGPDRGKISEYVQGLRSARRLLKGAKPGSASAAEAPYEVKLAKRALSRRIQRERGARRGLKPATSQQVLTGTVPAPPAKRVKAARPSGTLAKPRNLKPGAIAARKAKAAASGARAARATTNYNRAQKAALEAQQRVNRRRSPKNQAAADKAQKTLQTAARAYRILVGLGGEKMAVARKPSPKGAGPRMKAARPVGTVAKPRGLKVGAIAGRKGAAGGRVVYRTKKQAIASQRERNRRLSEYTKSAPGFSREWQNGPQSIKRKPIKVNQGNLLTGKTDRVVANMRTSQSGASSIGQSAASKRTQVRRDRAEARYNEILAERKAITGKGRNKAGVLARNSQRMAAVGAAFRVYDMGTGRKGPKRSTGRRKP